MPLEIPTRSDQVSSLQAYSRSYLPELDPTVTRRRGYIGGMIRSLGSALHDWYVKLKRYADREPFPQTATGEFLFQGWWSDITKLKPLAATGATGKVVITGTDGSILPAAAQMQGNNLNYTVNSSVGVVAQSLLIASLTRSGTTAIAETAGEHLLATGLSLTVSGAAQTEYNGTHAITVTAANEFTYEITGSPATPATGTILASGTWGNADITCTTKGQETNIDAGSALSIASAPVGVNSTALVTFGTIGGGTDAEDTESYRARVLEALGTDFGMFSAAEIRIVAKEIPGVTRVWVVEATDTGSNGVLPGQVKIYFMRDLDANPFPSGIEVETVRTHIIDTCKPAHTVDEDVMVDSPTRLDVDFPFTSITPDTASMRVAIKAALSQFFAESVDLGSDILEDDYRCAIKGTFDSERRQTLTSFVLGISGDIAVANDELPFLGDVTF